MGKSLGLLVGVAMLACLAAAYGALAAVADQALTDAGLTKVGNYYLLDLDQHLADRLREITTAQQQNTTIARQQQSFQSDIAGLNADIEDQKAKAADLKDRKDRTSGRARVARGFLDEQIKAADAQIKADEQKIAKDKSDSDALKPADVAELQTKLASDMDDAAAKYAQIAKDPAAQPALAQLDQAVPKLHLGPSQLFQQQLPRIRAARDKASGTKSDSSSGTTAGRVSSTTAPSK